MGKNSKAEFWKQVDDVMLFLIAKYPKAFFPKDSPETKPFECGIFFAIVQDNLSIKLRLLAHAVRSYTRKTRYIRAVATCSHRVNLAGDPVEAVADSHRKRAAEQLAKRDRQSLQKAA